MSSTSIMNSLKVVPSGGGVAADVEGVDLSKPLDGGTVAAIMAAWHEHGVLRFRDQDLSDPDLIAFSRHFGTLDKAPITTVDVPEASRYPEVTVISNVVVDGTPIGSLGSYESEWHTDMSYIDHPPKMSCLFALEVPPSGGDTGFVSMYAAHDALPPDLRKAVEGKSCKHDASRNSAGQLRRGFSEVDDPRDAPGAVHPLVIRHPETGRPALFLGRRRNAYVMGLPLDESEDLLDRLWAHATRPEFGWTQVWRKGDLILWDNRCTMHRRDAFDPAARRVMHRTQVQGGPLS